LKKPLNSLLTNKWLKRLFKYSLVLFVLLLFLEISYRYQWIDYYKAELKGLNEELESVKPNVLVFGDSFTAQSGSYLSHLKDSLPAYNFVNCGIPGTAAREAAYTCANRISRFEPKKVIYQMYLGNDLLDEQPPINWSELSIIRNWYWSFSRNFRVIGFFNYKFSQASTSFNTDFDEAFQSKNMEPFSSEKYSPRCKMLVQANPKYLQQTYFLESSMLGAFESNLAYIKEIQESLPDSVEFQLIVIPHGISINEKYQQAFAEFGAEFSQVNQYPIIKKLKESFPSMIDLSDVLIKAEESNNVVYFNNDDHLNLEGHRLVAKEIIDNVDW
jgi:hypothetical protein